MKRRLFMQMLGASVTAPAMPALGLAKSTAAISTAQSAYYNHHMFAHSLAMMRGRGVVRISTLMETMKLNPAQAHAMAAEFVEKGFAARYGDTLKAAEPSWLNNLEYLKNSSGVKQLGVFRIDDPHDAVDGPAWAMHGIRLAA